MKDEEEGRARNHVQHQAALNRNKSLERQLRAIERALERGPGKESALRCRCELNRIITKPFSINCENARISGSLFPAATVYLQCAYIVVCKVAA